MQSVVDFSARGPNRGMLDPPLDPQTGGVLQPRAVADGDIAGALTELGMTPECLASRLGVSLRTVHRWRSGSMLVPQPARRLIRVLLRCHRNGQPDPDPHPEP